MRIQLRRQWGPCLRWELLPLLWWRLRRAPAPGAWVGTALTVAGTVLILLR